MNALVGSQAKICSRTYAPLLFAHSSSFGAVSSLLLNLWQSCESADIGLEAYMKPLHVLREALVASQAKICPRTYAPLLFAHSSSFGAVSSLLLNQWQSCESADIRLEQKLT